MSGLLSFSIFRVCHRLFLLCLLALLSACSSLNYGHQAWQGQREVMRLSVPIDSLIDDPETDPLLRSRLALAQQARRFAVDHLGLPDNPSYTRFTALPRDYVLWNLFVTPPLSLEPQLYCYLFAGCMAYQGYFDEARAQEAAERWRAQGMDVYVGGVPAYSTLGLYDDPLLSSMMHWGDEYLAGLIFHELTHQQYFLANDTAFNESYASFVQEEGQRQWRAARELAPEDPLERRQREEFVRLMQDTREDLQRLYASDLSDADKHRGKAEGFEALRQRYRYLREHSWAGDGRFDGWLTEDFNNASLLPFGLYDQWVGAFARLFRQQGADWAAFHSAVRELGRLPEEARLAELERLAAD